MEPSDEIEKLQREATEKILAASVYRPIPIASRGAEPTTGEADLLREIDAAADLPASTNLWGLVRRCRASIAANAGLRAKLAERELMIDRLDNALATIQQWDCLNPPRADLLSDLPWLRGIVDNARTARQSAQAASQPSNPET